MADGPNPLRQGPENYSDLGDMLGSILSTFAKQMENMLPARVVSYDRVANTAIVKPLVKIILTASVQERMEIGPIPVFAAGAGNYLMNFPVAAGDLGWILANDRDVTNYMESLDLSEPRTYRSHSFNDSVFFPDSIRNFDTSGEDGNMVIQNKDGSVRISLGQERIMVKHPTKVIMDTPMVEFTGDGHMVGTFTADVDVIAAGISLVNHVHNPGDYKAGNTPVTGKSAKPE
jgi:hypothetical protein